MKKCLNVGLVSIRSVLILRFSDIYSNSQLWWKYVNECWTNQSRRHQSNIAGLWQQLRYITFRIVIITSRIIWCCPRLRRWPGFASFSFTVQTSSRYFSDLGRLKPNLLWIMTSNWIMTSSTYCTPNYFICWQHFVIITNSLSRLAVQKRVHSMFDWC